MSVRNLQVLDLRMQIRLSEERNSVAFSLQSCTWSTYSAVQLFGVIAIADICCFEI